MNVPAVRPPLGRLVIETATIDGVLVTRLKYRFTVAASGIDAYRVLAAHDGRMAYSVATHEAGWALPWQSIGGKEIPNQWEASDADVDGFFSLWPDPRDVLPRWLGQVSREAWLDYSEKERLARLVAAFLTR